MKASAVAPSRAACAASRSSPSTTSPYGRSDIKPGHWERQQDGLAEPDGREPAPAPDHGPDRRGHRRRLGPDRDHLMGVVGDRGGDGSVREPEAPDEAEPGARAPVGVADGRG